MTTFEPGASDVFTHGFTVRPFADGLLREEAGAEHDGRIRRVRAGRDRRDDDGAVREVVRDALSDRSRLCGSWREQPRESCLGRGRGRTAPRVPAVQARRHASIAALREPLSDDLRIDVRTFLFQENLQILSEDSLLFFSGTRSCGRFGPASDGSTVARSSSSVLVKSGLRRVASVRKRPCSFVVGLDERDESSAGRSVKLQVRDRLVVDGEEAHRRAVLGRHVRDRRAVRQRERGDAGAVELDELPDDALLAEHLRDGEDEVRRGRARGELSRASLKPTTSGMSIDCGWPRSAASASMPPTPQPRTPSPLIIVVWLSVPTSVSGYARPFSAPEDDAREVLEVHLVADARVGRHDAEVAERVLAPAEERVALLVALELELGVRREGLRASRTRPPAPSGR